MATKQPKYLQEQARVIAEIDAWRDVMLAAVNEMHAYAVGLANGNEKDYRLNGMYAQMPAEKLANKTLGKYTSYRFDARSAGETYRKMTARREKKEASDGN